MNDTTPWIMPDKSGTEQYTFRMDPLYKQAIQELADSETLLLGRKISMATVIFNLTTRNTDYIRETRIKLYERYKQLKKESE